MTGIVYEVCQLKRIEILVYVHYLPTDIVFCYNTPLQIEKPCCIHIKLLHILMMRFLFVLCINWKTQIRHIPSTKTFLLERAFCISLSRLL